MTTLKPPYPPAYLDPIFHQPMPERRAVRSNPVLAAPYTEEDLHEANRRMLENHRNSERRSAWRMRCLEEYGFVPDGDVAVWRAVTCEK